MTAPQKRSLSELKPMLFGRVTRVLFGIGSFVLIWVVGVDQLTPIGVLAMALLGASFLIGGLVGNPGCELTAIPNLVLSEKKRIHCL
jgi:hypothetical protein